MAVWLSVDQSGRLYYIDRIDRIVLFCSGLLKGQFAIFACKKKLCIRAGCGIGALLIGIPC